ncbi:MAG TPA: NADH-quinone oxidoreductase subunit NuoG [Pseudomonadales bacterium]|nr:NADH-quinone oxidoreductase subunit NuoG [Pseudomonadales bacterium]
MATIRIDGQEYKVEAGQNLLHVALSKTIDLPYFCWHPALGSVGACRQCAVIQYGSDEDEKGRLVMACMTPVADGMRFSVQAAHAVDFRRSVVEWLMMSHPHDCPVCEEGGECHLQDMTVMTGHVHRVYPGTKRTWTNQYLGPFLNHEMNRCITCYRCVRFYRDYAGGTDLEDMGSRDRVYFGRQQEGVLENEFSGNLVEVCPTGVFTDKPFSKHYTRKWDLQSAPSVCPGCALGCTTLVASRYGDLRRVHNRYHPDVNGYFLCDRGRFGQAYVNSGRRLRQVGRRGDDDAFDAVDAQTLLAELAPRLKEATAAGRCIGIGSPRASLETNFALARLVGAANFSAGFAEDEGALVHAALEGLRAGPARIPTLKEVEDADAILVLGEDPIDSAPRLALSLRQAVHASAFAAAEAAGIPLWQDAGVRSHGRYSRHPLFLATVLPSRSAEFAADTLNASPARLAAVGEAIAAAIAAGATAAPADDDFAARTAAALLAAERPLVVSGTSTAAPAVLQAAQAVVDALAAAGRDVGALMIAQEANAFGAALLEAELDAGGAGASSLETLLARLEGDEVDLLVVAENDLLRRGDPQRIGAALAHAKTVVVLDAIEHDTAALAHALLPAATVAESEGTFVSSEGRAQRFFPAIDAAQPVRPSWRWLTELATAAGRDDLAFTHVDEVTAACAAALPALAAIGAAAPGASWRDGVGLKVAREAPRASGRTAMRADVSVHEPRTHQDPESALAWSMEGDNRPGIPAALTPYYWSPGWNSNQSVTRFQQEVGGELKGGPAGCRLLEPRGGTARVEVAAAAESEGLRLVPLRHIFGSDELSALAPAVAERMPVPMLLLAPADAERQGLRAGEGVRLLVAERARGIFRLGVDPALSEGWAAYSAGLPGTPASMPRGAVRLEAVPDWTPPTVDDVIARG